MTTHRDLTTPEEVLAALRAGERVQYVPRGLNVWADSSYTGREPADAYHLASDMARGFLYRAVVPSPRTFTAAEVAEVVAGIVGDWRANESSCVMRAFVVRHECADELHERITHWLRENENG